MNVRRPGFQLLSLAPAQLRHDDVPTYKDVPCLLPDQLRIYLIIYLPLLAISIILVCLSNIVNCSLLTWRSPLRDKLSSMEYAMPSSSSSISSSSTKFEDQDDKVGPQELNPYYTSGSQAWRMFTPEDEHQNRRHHPSYICSNCAKVLLYFRPGRSRLNFQRGRGKGWLTSTMRDIEHIAIFPLSLFVIITWWTIAA